MSDTFDYSVVSPDWRDELMELSDNLRKLIKSTTPLAREVGEKLATAKERIASWAVYLILQIGIGAGSALGAALHANCRACSIYRP